MDNDKILGELEGIWLPLADRQPTRQEAETFLLMYREMQRLDRVVAPPAERS